MGEEAGLEQSPTFNKSRMAPGIACGLAGAFIAMLAIVLLLYINEKPPQPVRTTEFCCPQVLRDIFGGANQSIDPCRSISYHTCYAHIVTRDGSTEPPALNNDPVDGNPTTEPGRAVAAYLRACLSLGETEATQNGRAAANALLNVTSPPTSSPTSHSLVALIIELSLKYGLPSLIQFGLETGVNSTVHLKVSPAPLDSLPENLPVSMLSAFKADALDVVNHYFSLNLNLQEVDAFLAKVTDSRAYTTENYTLDSFGEIHSELTAVQWKEILGAFGVTDRVPVLGVSLQELKVKFAHILDLNQRMLSLVSALVSASRRLASRLVIEATTSEARRLECRKRANELLPLLVLDRVEYFRSESQDDAVIEAFKIVAGAVVNRSRSGMESGDFRKLATALNEIRVALPSQLVPEGLAIPTMTSNYASAELLARTYVRRAQVHQMISWGVSEGFSKHFLEPKASFTEGIFIVPTRVYSAVPLVDGADELLLASTVGVPIADAIWDFVFEGDWGPASNVALREYGSCIQNNSRSLIEGPSETSWLSLATSIDAVRMHGHWDSLVRPSGAWEVTRRQLFYMSFVHYLLCRDPRSKLDFFGLDVDIFLSAFEDFYHSFHCGTTVSPLTGDVCSLHLRDNTA